MRTRWPLVGLAVTTLLAGCDGCDGGNTGPNGPARDDETVTIAAANGEVEAPVTTENIWALDEHAALYLLALGVTPEHAANTFDTEPAITILEDADIEIVEPDNLELVAAADPDLIVGIPYSGHIRLEPQMERIAPIVLLPDGSTTEGLYIAGSITGKSAEATTIAERVDTATGDLANRVADSDLAGATVSVLSGTTNETIYAYDFRHILTPLGLDQPPTQTNLDAFPDSGYAEVSPERLDDHRADVIIAMTDGHDERSVLDDPLFDTQGSVTAEVYWRIWYSPSPLADWWVLHDLDAILLDHGTAATPADAPRLWAQMTDTDRRTAG